MSAPWRDIYICIPKIPRLYIYTQDPQIVTSIWGIFRSRISGWTVGFQTPFFHFSSIWLAAHGVNLWIQRPPFCSQVGKASKNKIFKSKGYHSAAYVVARVGANKILKKRKFWIFGFQLVAHSRIKNWKFPYVHACAHVCRLHFL